MRKFTLTLLTIALAGLLSSFALAWEEAVEVSLPDPGVGLLHDGTSLVTREFRDPDLLPGWPVFLGTPGAGFPYTPTLFDVTGDGADEIFCTGGHTFGLRGDGTFLPGWPTTEHLHMGYGTNGQMPGPSVADMTGTGTVAVLWSQRDWYAGSSFMWSFNGRLPGGGNLGSFPQSAPDAGSNALASPFVLGDANGDGNLEAWSAHTLGNTGDYYRISGFDHTGTRLFTRDLNPSEQILNVYFGDLEGNGQDAFFVVTLLSGTFRLIAFESSGTIQQGYPVVLYTPGGSGYPMFGPPPVMDMDGDGSLEIILGMNVSSVSHAMAVKHDGTPVPGFPRTIATQSQLFYLGLGDVVGNGQPELIAFDNHLGSNYRVHVFDLASGDVLPGWPVPVPNWPKGFPTVVDVDNDEVQDIVFVTDGARLYALNGTGALLNGYPKTMASGSISGAAAGDITGDGFYDLVAVTWDGWAYAWKTQGVVAAGNADWPMRGVDARNTGIFRQGEDTSSVGDGADQAGSGRFGKPAIVSVEPNPFNLAATIMLELEQSGPAAMAVHDVSGRLVRTLVNGDIAAGRQSFAWDGTDDRGQASPSGVYMVRLILADGSRQSAKITLNR